MASKLRRHPADDTASCRLLEDTVAEVRRPTHLAEGHIRWVVQLEGSTITNQ